MLPYGTNVNNPKEKRYLNPSTCRIPVIYTLPKIHRNPLIPSACPIINGIGSVTSRLGEYLDKFLQPNVRATKAYLKDTTDILQSLDEMRLDPDTTTFLVTADVSSLYTIMMMALALNWPLGKMNDIPHAQKGFLGKALFLFLYFCISHNYFWYHGQFYSQQVGVAMDAKFAPSLANLFMTEWEDRHVFNRYRPQMKFYRRFIDDLLIIWAGSREFALEFIFHLNHSSNNIKLDYQLSDHSVNFFDVTIDKSENRLTIRVFFRPTDRNSYLSIRSGYHPTWIRNIPKGQMLRV